LEESPYDITGISDSIQMRHHIQSYFMHFKGNCFSNPAIERFWEEIFVQVNKLGVIQAYELGLTATAQANGLFVGALFPWNLVGQYRHNPSVDRWKKLLDLGFPFVKREVARESSKTDRAKILDLLVKKYGIDQDFQNEINNSAQA
jgi:lipopolysaccharide biosynthesis protein